ALLSPHPPRTRQHQRPLAISRYAVPYPHRYAHGDRSAVSIRAMIVAPVSLATAVDRTRTGVLWLFRGRTTADRLIQTLTNAPVNHVGVAIVLEDMPPL